MVKYDFYLDSIFNCSGYKLFFKVANYLKLLDGSNGSKGSEILYLDFLEKESSIITEYFSN